MLFACVFPSLRIIHCSHTAFVNYDFLSQQAFAQPAFIDYFENYCLTCVNYISSHFVTLEDNIWYNDSFHFKPTHTWVYHHGTCKVKATSIIACFVYGQLQSVHSVLHVTAIASLVGSFDFLVWHILYKHTSCFCMKVCMPFQFIVACWKCQIMFC